MDPVSAAPTPNRKSVVARRAWTAALVAGVASILLPGCSGGADSFKPASIEIDRPTVYPLDKKDKTALAVMRIKNKGGSADRLLRASSKRSGPILLQRTIMVDGSPIVRTVQAINLPAGQTVELDPNAYTLKLERVGEELKDGGTFPVTLEFMVAGELPVTFTTKTSGPALPKPVPTASVGGVPASGAPLSIEGLEEGKYGNKDAPKTKKTTSEASQPASAAQTTASQPAKSDTSK